MYLDIGKDMAVRDRSIIGIFDLENTSTSRRTVEFLNHAEKEGQVVPCDELPKSFLLTDDDKVYFSQISTQSLVGRVE